MAVGDGVSVDASILVLFDIDGTLVHTVGAGIRGMNRAFDALFGVSHALDGVPVAGRTDRAIVHEVFERERLEATPERVWTLRDGYLAELPRTMATPVDDGFGVLPGVLAGLEAIDGGPAVHLGASDG